MLKNETYFKDKKFQLLLGDSISLMKKIKPMSIDMIFADPPYLLSNNGITVHSGEMVSVNKGEWDVSKGVDEDFKFHDAWIKAAKRLLKPNGTIWISGTYHSIYLCGHSLQKHGYKILNEITWFKPNGAPNISCRYFTASHETLIWAGKDNKTKHTFNYEDMKFSKWENDHFKNEDKQMRSVWSIATPSKNEKLEGKHPTQKPIALLERLIRASTNEGDVILDPFTGSSTTGIAAHKLNRNFVGIDNNQEYLNLSKKRYNTLQNEMA